MPHTNNSHKNRSVLKDFVEPHALAGLAPDSAVLLAFSGGPDSRVLLHLLAKDAEQKGYRLYVGHINHGIRGEEADRDEAFCRDTAALYRLPFLSKRIDVPSLAKARNESIETAARNARYACLSEWMKEYDIPLLVTAHNADDNLETVLLDLLRGAGLDGMCGIPPTRKIERGILARPLLRVTREQILGYCHSHSLSYVIDSTNTDTQYTRNRIRSEVLPALYALQPSVLPHTTRMCDILREDAEYLNESATRFLQETLCDGAWDIRALADAPKPIASRALMMHFRTISGGVALSATQVAALLELSGKAIPHSSLCLPEQITASVENGMLRFGKTASALPDIPAYATVLHEGSNFISQTNCEIVIGNSQSNINVYKKEIRMYFASDKINGDIVARNRLSGDKILTHGMHKDVRRMMSEKKIPLLLRARIPILCDEDGILAVPFVAVRDGAKAKKENQETARIVSVYFGFDA